MSKEKLITQKYPIDCKGRNLQGGDALNTPVKVIVEVYQHPDNETSIHTFVDCCFIDGACADKCGVVDLFNKTVLRNIPCPFATSLPYTVDALRNNTR